MMIQLSLLFRINTCAEGSREGLKLVDYVRIILIPFGNKVYFHEVLLTPSEFRYLISLFGKFYPQGSSTLFV